MKLQKSSFLFVLLTLASAAAQAGYVLIGGVPAPCGAGGNTFESATRLATFTVFLTDCNGNRIGRTPFTTVTGNNLLIAVPGTFNNVPVGDVTNITNLSHSPGEASELRLESLVLDPTTNLAVFEGLYARIAIEVGAGVQVLVPDLYGDTNGDGVLADPDLLYSLVDMHQYLKAIPAFALGQVFSIVNGQVDALPGMLFSTTPFVFDASAPTGFDYTPFNGDGTTGSLHGLTAAVPEPTSVALLGVGVLALFGRKWRRRSAS